MQTLDEGFFLYYNKAVWQLDKVAKKHFREKFMQYVFPKRIVSAQNVEQAESLLKEKSLQIGLSETDCALLKGKGYIILDYGEEVSGGARILTFAARGGNAVRLRFGESVGETCSALGRGIGYATNDHSNRDFTVNLRDYSDMTFGQTGFRFLRIDNLEENAEFSIKTVVAAVDTDTREEIGAFECDDALVNEIWTTAARTIRLCLQNGYFWDGVKRDRLVWIGDLYPEMRAAQCLFGDVPETENSLAFVHSQTPLSKWMNNIPAYSLWWLIILADEYAVKGDKTPFIAYLPYIKGLVQQVSDHVKEDGETTYPWDFIDWPSCFHETETKENADVKKADSHAGVAFLTKIAMQKTADFLRVCGEDDSLCMDVLRRLDKKEQTVLQYKQIAGLGVWSGCKSEAYKEVLLRGGAKGLSTFMSYPILTSIAAYGEEEAALSMMKEYYGGMLSVGATTFWEDFDLDWLENCGRIDEMLEEGKVDIHGGKGAFCYTGYRHSFCHGWSAGVIPYLAETVAGIYPVGVGLKKFRIQPKLSGLKHLKIAYPVAGGVLRVEHTLQPDGSVQTQVEKPDGVEIVK